MREREREREMRGEREDEREREERERVGDRESERERWSHHRGVTVCHKHLNRSLCTNTMSFITVSVTRLCSSFGLELMVKLRALFNCLYIHFES